ncbi:MAG: hypothetical protein IPM69_18050 [Ignavibacteria bacterium]|nr:hypothetical protein [Ignavibacteria bacterium]
MKPITENEDKEFYYRIDFYWQAIAVYAVALVLYSLLRGTIDSGQLSITLHDPIVVLLAIFVITTAIGAGISRFMNRRLIFTANGIILRNRFRERIFHKNDIQRISFGKERPSREGAYRIVKIRIAGRRRLLRIRPAGFDNERELTRSLTQLKRSISPKVMAK